MGTAVLVKHKWNHRDILSNIIDYKHLHAQGSHWRFCPFSATIVPSKKGFVYF